MHFSLFYHPSSFCAPLPLFLYLYLDVRALCLDELLVDVGPHGPHLVDLRVELTAAVTDLTNQQTHKTMRRGDHWQGHLVVHDRGDANLYHNRVHM